MPNGRIYKLGERFSVQQGLQGIARQFIARLNYKPDSSGPVGTTENFSPAGPWGTGQIKDFRPRQRIVELFSDAPAGQGELLPQLVNTPVPNLQFGRAMTGDSAKLEVWHSGQSFC